MVSSNSAGNTINIDDIFKKFENSRGAIIVVGPDTNDESRESINETMNHNLPSNKACKQVELVRASGSDWNKSLTMLSIVMPEGVGVGNPVDSAVNPTNSKGIDGRTMDP